MALVGIPYKFPDPKLNQVFRELARGINDNNDSIAALDEDIGGDGGGATFEMGDFAETSVLGTENWILVYDKFNERHWRVGLEVLIDMVQTPWETDGDNIWYDVGAGQVMIGTNDPDANVTQGLCIDQGAYDDQAFTIKSSDVSHEYWNSHDVDVYCSMKKYSATTGGLLITGLSEVAATVGIELRGGGGTCDETKTSAGIANIMLSATRGGDGTMVACSANDNLVAIRNFTTTTHIFDADGDTWTSGDLTCVNLICPGTGHDGFSDFVADEHVAHSGVTLTAGTGLSGGGDITVNRTFDVDVGIANNKIMQVDDADAADNDYAKFTASGLEGRSYAEVLTDLSGQAGAAFEWGGQNISKINSIYLTEQADADADVAGDGQIWVNTAEPNELWFTNDAGADFQLGVAGSDKKVGVDAAATAGYLGVAINDGVLRFTANQFTAADGGDFVTFSLADHATARTALGLAIGTDVLAEQTIGIADNNLLEVDDADAADNDYAKFTASGLEGRSYAEVLTDLSGQAGAAFDWGGQNLTNIGTGHDVFSDFVANEHIDYTGAIDNTNYVVKTTAKARAYASASLDDISTGAWTTVPLNTEDYDPGSNFNTTTYQFTTPVAGYYTLHGTVLLGDITTDKRYGVGIRNVTDSTWETITYYVIGSSVEGCIFACSTVSYIGASKALELRVYQNTGGASVDIDLGDPQTHMSIHLLSV